MIKKHGHAHNIALKKSYGQHFLRDDIVAQKIVNSVALDQSSSVFEIGCGDGALTRMILQTPIARLWVFEIDPEWATFVQKKLPDARLTVHVQNFLDLDFSILQPYKPWTILANLPYQITFPILSKLQEHRDLIKEGVIMVQEEVAKKIVATHGRGYGFASLFFQHYFEWKLLDKVPPSSFYPAPKVFSRLVYFKPIAHPPTIAKQQEFWDFIKACFKQPRRTLKNNLSKYHYLSSKIPDTILELRAQQMSMQDLLNLWDILLKD